MTGDVLPSADATPTEIAALFDALPAPAFERFKDPAGYAADPGAEKAATVALLLGQPLLVTGEPGAGKTRLAHWIGHRLKLPVLEYAVKSTTTASDLFYSFDELARFRDSQEIGARPPLETYLHFNALGAAILLAGGSDAPLKAMPGRRLATDRSLGSLIVGAAEFGRGVSGAAVFDAMPKRSVVLIDEIDKAPRDTPNDMLNEIERLGFNIPEVGARVELPADHKVRPVVVLTSNSEKSLPDAFLRRCVFVDLAFPGDNALRAIVAARISGLPAGCRLVKGAVSLFMALRDPTKDLRKRPGTAEWLGWIATLQHRGVPSDDSIKGDKHAPLVESTVLDTLTKTREDRGAAKRILDEWRARKD